jgi:spore coat polysaccharide biosynthesis protein SpsF
MGSSRLPNKVLAMIAGRPMLEHIIHRVRNSMLISELLVATTRLPEDDAVESLATDLGILCYRGSEQNVLDRYYQAAKQMKAEVVVRLTGDNPLVDGNFVDWVIEEYLMSNPPCEYIDTISSKSFPVGLSVEVFSFQALEVAWQQCSEPADREHVTPFIRANPQRFATRQLLSLENNSDLRWTVDTSEDLQVICSLYETLNLDNRTMPYQEIVAYVRAHPKLVGKGGRI